MKFCIVDRRAGSKLISGIESHGFEAVLMPSNKNVSALCQSHPDISLFRISDNEIIYSPECDENFLSDLQKRGISLIKGGTYLSENYPDDIKYNASIIGNYLLHKLNSTDSKILHECELRNIKFLNVKQGYTGCSLAVINQDTAMTSDIGIYNALKAAGDVKILLIPPQKCIRLEGAEYGFIGGAGGRIDRNNYAVAGKAACLESYHIIKEFLASNHVDLISLSDEKPLDVGTLMFFTI